MKELLFAQSPVNAQGTSLVTEPSFPYTGVSASSSSSQSGKSANMILSAANGNVIVGDSVKVDVIINTSALSIKEYRIKLLFPKNLVQVQDASPDAGVQVNFLETAFTKTQNTSSNENGTIELRATTSTAVTVNRKVAEITLKGLSAGSVQVTSDNTVSLVVANDNSQVSLTTTALNLTVSGQTVVSSSTSSITLPRGGIAEDLSAIWIPTLVSILLIGVGVRAFISGRKYIQK